MSKRHLEEEEEELADIGDRLQTHRNNHGPSTIYCSLSPCNNVPFSNYELYEAHYATCHFNRCLTCSRTFPDENLLNLHFNENHNPLSDIRRERGEKVYKCFVESCMYYSASPRKRRLHLIQKHDFPIEFYFDIVNTGILPDRISLLEGE